MVTELPLVKPCAVAVVTTKLPETFAILVMVTVPVPVTRASKMVMACVDAVVRELMLIVVAPLVKKVRVFGVDALLSVVIALRSVRAVTVLIRYPLSVVTAKVPRLSAAALMSVLVVLNGKLESWLPATQLPKLPWVQVYRLRVVWLAGNAVRICCATPPFSTMSPSGLSELPPTPWGLKLQKLEP